MIRFCILFVLLPPLALFLWIWDIDESARRIWGWRHASAILTGIVCFGFGAIGSEFIQSLLPYKTFQIGDVIANILGASLGLYLSHALERRHRRRRELARLYTPLNPADGYPSDDEEDAHGPGSGRQLFGASDGRVWDDSASEIFMLEDDEERSERGQTSH